MKNYLKLITSLTMIAFVSCKKDNAGGALPATFTDNYSSINNFYSVNGVQAQQYIIDAVTGGSFTTPQGTTVNIPANAFVTQSNQPVTGNVTVKFKDIYKKSDMLLSDIPAMLEYGQPLKSGGEFYIKVNSGASVVQMAPGKKIDVNQPVLNSGGLDTAMIPLAILADTLQPAPISGWLQNPQDSLLFNASHYVFSMYQFNSPLDSGSWCNSDNATYFASFTQSTLTIHPNDDNSIYHQDVFLVFHNLNTMIHVYYNGIADYPYYYAPVGLQCTIVAVGIKDGVLYSSFTPITIGTSQTINFTLSQTTTADFKTRLNSLN